MSVDLSTAASRERDPGGDRRAVRTELDDTFPASAVGTPLEFACHLAGHYEPGMHTLTTVQRSASRRPVQPSSVW